MLENLVAWVLNNYIGEYLENLNTDQLSVALLSGQVELENVPLKKTALRKLDLPLEVRSGLLGKLTLSVPITHLRSEPWTLKLSDVLIIVGPPPADRRYDVEAVEQVEQQRKEHMLGELEQRHKAALLDVLGIPMPESQDSWWGASLISTVLNNIQLILNNVHIRYEDNLTLPVAFNFGIRIQKMTMQTTNSSWKSGFAEPQEGVNVFKKLDLSGFSIYWNSDTAVSTDIDTPKRLREILAPETFSNAYIIQPCNAELRMEKNSSKFPLKSKTPRFKFFLRHEIIACELTRRQMAELRALNREWARFERARQHRKWRPLTQVGGNAREWWQFAYNRVIDESRRSQSNRTWHFASTRARHLNAYCRAYRRRLLGLIANPSASDAVADPGPANAAPSSPGNTPVGSMEDRTIMKQIERDAQYTYHELHLFRETVFRRLLREKEVETGVTSMTSSIDTEDKFEALEPPPANELIFEPDVPIQEAQQANAGGGLYSWITGFFVNQPQGEIKEEQKLDFGNVDVSDLRKMPSSDTVKEIEGEILDVLNESWDDSTVLRRDVLLAEIALRLEHLTLRFVDSEIVKGVEQRRILAMELSGVSSRLELSPKQHSLAVDVTVHDMSVQRLRTGYPPAKSKIAELSESLLYSTSEATKMLLGIGRDADDKEIASDKVPMFSMHYSRRSPRLVTRHFVNCRLRPVSAFYEEGALDGLALLFADDPDMFVVKTQKDGVNTTLTVTSPALDTTTIVDDELISPTATSELSIIESHVHVKLEVPHIRMEVRGKGWTRRDLRSAAEWEPGESLARFDVERLVFGVESKDPHLTKITLEMGHLHLEDVLENTKYMLLSTSPSISAGTTKSSVSTSCPNLHKSRTPPPNARPSASDDVVASASVPSSSVLDQVKNGTLHTPSFALSNGSIEHPLAPMTQYSTAKTTTTTSSQSTPVGPEATISVVLVDKMHPEFETKYKKRNCTVEMDMNELEMQMNRRTWTALIEMAGLLGDDEVETGKENSTSTKVPDNSLKPSAFCVACVVRARSWRIGMPFPRNKTRLGTILFENAELESTVKLNVVLETMSVVLSLDGARIDDSTQDYSEMYPERVVLVDEERNSQMTSAQMTANANPASLTKRAQLPMERRARVNIVKYLGEDRSRECDLRIEFHVPSTMRFYYVHTHRFFCGLMDFWTQFNELQDLVAKSKKVKVIDGVRARVSLDVAMKCATNIVMPLNQTCEDALLWQASGLTVKNTFRTMSTLDEEIFEKYCIETDYGYDEAVDCLLDFGDVVLSDVSAREAKRIDRARLLFDDRNYLTIGDEAFNTFAFVVSQEHVFSKKFDMTTTFLRNLDGANSHNAPDLTIITAIRGLSWRLTTEFYILMRGVLEKNLGDPLIPQPETIPIEILQRPFSGCEIASQNKYATLSFRLVFEDVLLDCQVPRPNAPPAACLFGTYWQPFAKMQLDSARVSFDVFVDGQSELDLICQKTKLVDTRPCLLSNGQKNCYPVILQHREVSGKTPSTSTLMSEAHLMMKKDEPPVLTLVLCNAKVILAQDWLNDAKEFVLLYTPFIPKYSDEPSRAEVVGVTKSRDGSVVERSKGSIETTNAEQTFAVKITLRDSDLYILENPSAENSFAMVASTTAVLNMNDSGGDISANLEIQSITLGWCAMQHESTTRNHCSNEFSLAFSFDVDRPMQNSSSTTLVSVRSPGLELPQKSRHHLEVEFHKMIGRLSYKDARVLKAVLVGYQKYLAESAGKSLIPVLVNKPPPRTLDFGKISIKTEHADLWLLDDFQGSSIPLLRLSLSNVSVTKAGERIKAKITLSADYFNQRVFGWEPLIEKWRILRFLSHVKEKSHTIELVAETKSTLNVNVTEQLMQQAMQWSSRLPAIKASFERDDFRNQCIRSRSDHLPYVLKNETGCELSFTTAVDDVLTARNAQRKSTIRWTAVGRGKDHTFEFPTRLLLYSHLEREPPRQLIVRVSGWDEISPVNVDACGTYFRIVKAIKTGLQNARLVIAVTMEKDGKKVVTIRSSIDVSNELPHTIAVQTEGAKGELMTVEPGGRVSVPLEFAHTPLTVYPVGSVQVTEHAVLSWRTVKVAGEVCNQTQRLRTRSTSSNQFYWLCTSVRREYYPEHEFESLPGHCICVVAPLTLQNLLPIDMEVTVQNHVFAIGAGKSLMITTVDITQELSVKVSTDRLVSAAPISICKWQIDKGQRKNMKLRDDNNRSLDMYAHVRLGNAQSISVSFWVPYWIVNKSGLPLVIQQDAAKIDAAGQIPDHESAKDRHPLMFSFSEENCPHACRVRLGKKFARDPGYEPLLSDKFSLTPGVQALKLKIEHKTLPTMYYNIGVEVRAGTGRYKDTQVVLLTSRYILQNQSSVALSVCHHDLIDRPKEHVHLAAQSSLTWNENYEARRMLCVRRADVKHWSCPFSIDRIGSFHVTMRDADETPRFIRVEIILTSAVFNVTFTDADYYPPPIRIDNQTDVPVLYQQECQTPARQHLRTICKAKSFVDYSWDDLYGTRKIVLQVFENRSKSYDMVMPGLSEPLVYENNSFIQLTISFKNASKATKTEECELVLETMQKGKVMLNKQNRTDGNSGNQLWKLCPDGCIENTGMSMRSRQDSRMVLDVLEKNGNRLMMMERDSKRNKYQRWTLMPDGRLCLYEAPQLMVTSRQTEVCAATVDKTAPRGEDGVAETQMWRVQRQRPGSGILDVECLHSGPTVVLRVTDRENQTRAVSEPVLPSANIGITDLSITMRGGFGISVINGLYEELMYAHFGGIVLSARRVNATYQLTGSVDVIQVDNQLLSSDRWQVLYCQPDAERHEDEQHFEDVPAGVALTTRPALKVEMNYTPMKHYDSFDCFRVRVCDVWMQLDELLLWKIAQMAQSTDTAASVQQKALNLPPNIELERHDPLRTRRWYFGTLDLEMGQVALSVVTVPKSGLPRDLRHIKQQFNVKLISFENASVSLPPFRQYHYFETSAFLLESLKNFYLAELQKQTLNIIVTLDAFGNPLGLVTDLKDSFQGLFIEGDVQRFVAGLGYGLSNSVSKVASSVASGVGSFTFDQEHELKRRHNMIRSHSTSSTPLTHLYSGVKGLGVGVLGGATAIFTNFVTETKKNGMMRGIVRGVATGTVDTVTKPVQGIFDFVEGTASAFKELAMPANIRKSAATSRVRAPRLCRNLYHLLPTYDDRLAYSQLELLRINGYSPKERLLDLETCLEQMDGADKVIRQYVLISTKQCYVCRQINGESSVVIQRIAYKYLKSVTPQPPLENTFASIEVRLDMEDSRLRQLHIWCSRIEVAKRLCDKMLMAKQQYDHGKRTLNERAMNKGRNEQDE